MTNMIDFEKDINLLQGDCLELMKDVPDKSIDLILTDLPYGVVNKNKCKWDQVIPFDGLWNCYNRIIKDRGAIVLNAMEPFASKLRLSNLKYYKYDWIWDKIKGTGFLNSKKQPMRNHEVLCVFYKKQCKYNPQITHGHAKKVSHRSKDLQTDVYGHMKEDHYYESTDRYPRSIQVFSTDTQNSSLHPTQKPVALCEYMIKTYTDKGEIVLDSCMGSGTTGVAAKKLNRRFIGMEKDERFYKIACERINNVKEEQDDEAI